MLLVAICAKADEGNPAIKIIQPLDRSIYVSSHANLVIDTLDTNITKIVLYVNDKHTEELNITSEKRTYCKAIIIKLGENNIKLNTYAGDMLLQSSKLQLYYYSELYENAEEESEEYEKRYFHTGVKEDKCKACHDMSSNVPTDGEAFEDVTRTTCYGCHEKMMDTRNSHAPAANWLCLDCHNGKAGEYNMDQQGLVKYLVRDPVARTCGTCHEDIEGWFMKEYTHGPTNDGRCIRCHNPHGSDNEFFLRKPVWDLCTTCHAEKANGKHVIPAIGFGRNPTAGGHPTKDRKDPARKGRDFYCSSCHNPHGSEGIFLLRMKGSFTYGVCQRCHQK